MAHHDLVEPSARSEPFSTIVEGKVYLWGGFNLDLAKGQISLQEFVAIICLPL